ALLQSTGDGLGGAIPLDVECYAVVMNHNFADDQAYLRALLKTPVSYIGVLGPRQRTDRMLRNLAAQGPVDEGRVYGPVGLDIGTDGAEQVAVAVIVEVLGHEADRARAVLGDLPVDLALNPNFTGPTSTSLHAGLDRLGRDVDAAVVLLGDMVHVSEAALAELVSRARTSDAPLVVSRYGDVTAPPLLFRRLLFGELRAWTGEGCGKAVVQAHQHEALYVDRGPEMLEDVDTPEDFQKAQNSSS